MLNRIIALAITAAAVAATATALGLFFNSS